MAPTKTAYARSVTMTGCNTCGATTKVVASAGGTKSGLFRERYECANGHTGTITGNAEQPAKHWNRYGEVFDNE